MKAYSPQLIAEKAKANVTTYWFIRIGDFCFTDCPETIDHSGMTYIYYPIKLSAIEVSDANTMDGCQIELGSVDLTAASLVLNNTIKYADVTIEEVWFDSTMTEIDSEIVFTGKVDGRPELNEEFAIITVSPHKNPWTARFPGTMISKYNFPNIPERGTKIAWWDMVITIE